MITHENELKVISFTLKDMSLVPLNTMMHENNIEWNEFWESIEYAVTNLAIYWFLLFVIYFRQFHNVDKKVGPLLHS